MPFHSASVLAQCNAFRLSEKAASDRRSKSVPLRSKTSYPVLPNNPWNQRISAALSQNKNQSQISMLKINKTSEHANNAYFIFLFLHRIANTRMHKAIAISNIVIFPSLLYPCSNIQIFLFYAPNVFLRLLYRHSTPIEVPPWLQGDKLKQG